MLKVEQADVRVAERIMHNVRGYAVKLPHKEHWLIQTVAKHREDTALPLREALERVNLLVDEIGDGDTRIQDGLFLIKQSVTKAISPDTTGGE